MIKVFPRAWGNPMLHFYFQFFPTALGPFIQQTLLSTYVAGIRLGSAGRILMNEMWHGPWEMISKSVKLPYSLEKFYWVLTLVFFSSICLLFFLCDLFLLCATSELCTYFYNNLHPTILHLSDYAPAPSLEAEAMPYSYSYSKCHNGWYGDFFLIYWIWT